MENQIQVGYKKLVVWQKAMELVEVLYRLTKKFPADERYGITSQIRRAAISIPSNIAEGCYRRSRAEFRHFLIIAYGSGAELETQLEISRRLGYNDELSFHMIEPRLNEVMRLLNAIIRSMSSD